MMCCYLNVHSRAKGLTCRTHRPVPRGRQGFENRMFTIQRLYSLWPFVASQWKTKPGFNPPDCTGMSCHCRRGIDFGSSQISERKTASASFPITLVLRYRWINHQHVRNGSLNCFLIHVSPVLKTGSVFSQSVCLFRQPLWSSGQSFWLQIQRSRVRFPALPDFLSSSGSVTGSTQPREVNWGATWIKSSGSGPENRD